jgi:GNAT superfamily N-acetyltransferase
LVVSTSQIIGFTTLRVLTPESSDYKENGHNVRTQVEVHSDHRRKGLGTELIKILCQRGLELRKTEITFYSSALSGQKFMEQFNVISALDSADNKLFLNQVNWDTVKKWNDIATQKSITSKIELFEYIPEEIIDEYAQVHTSVLNDVPFGELGLQFTITSDLIRKWEAYERELGYKQLIMISKESNGKISGITEIKYNHYQPQMIDQGITGVLKEYRGRNLGLRLKTEMLLLIRERFPKAKFINTGNADDNAHMLRINNLLGFKKSVSWKSYKSRIVDLLAKIA